MIFKIKTDIEKAEIDKVKLAKKYLRILKTSDTLPPNSREMFKAIKKAGLNDKT